jgi:hypothetical protein
MVACTGMIPTDGSTGEITRATNTCGMLSTRTSILVSRSGLVPQFKNSDDDGETQIHGGDMHSGGGRTSHFSGRSYFSRTSRLGSFAPYHRSGLHFYEGWQNSNYAPVLNPVFLPAPTTVRPAPFQTAQPGAQPITAWSNTLIPQAANQSSSWRNPAPDFYDPQTTKSDKRVPAPTGRAKPADPGLK